VVADYYDAQLGDLVSVPVLARGEGAVEVLQLSPGGECGGHDPGAATERLVGTRSTRRAVTMPGHLERRRPVPTAFGERLRDGV
jgi:hypothetical protein